jgi:hypothetical protein
VVLISRSSNDECWTRFPPRPLYSARNGSRFVDRVKDSQPILSPPVTKYIYSLRSKSTKYCRAVSTISCSGNEQEICLRLQNIEKAPAGAFSRYRFVLLTPRKHRSVLTTVRIRVNDKQLSFTPGWALASLAKSKLLTFN